MAFLNQLLTCQLLLLSPSRRTAELMTLVERSLAPWSSVASQDYPHHLEADCLFTAPLRRLCLCRSRGVGPGDSWALWSGVQGERRSPAQAAAASGTGGSGRPSHRGRFSQIQLNHHSGFDVMPILSYNSLRKLNIFLKPQQHLSKYLSVFKYLRYLLSLLEALTPSVPASVP